MQRRFRKKEALAKRATSKVSFDDDNAAPTRIFIKMLLLREFQQIARSLRKISIALFA